MSIVFRLTNTIYSNSLHFILIPHLELQLYQSIAERIIGIRFMFLLWGFSIDLQWYRNKYVEELRKEYNKLQEKVDSETGLPY